MMEQRSITGNSEIGKKIPKILIITSRNPSNRLLSFAKEIKLLIPNAQRINRGGRIIQDIVKTATEYAFTDIIFLSENKGNPDGIFISHLPRGPTAYFGINNLLMRHDIGYKKNVGTISDFYPHLIFEGFGSKLGERVKYILKNLFPNSKVKTTRVITFFNQFDLVIFRHHKFQTPKSQQTPQLIELGPKFELKLFLIKLGTLEQTDAEIEWVFRPSIRSAKKPKLSEISKIA